MSGSRPVRRSSSGNGRCFAHEKTRVAGIAVTVAQLAFSVGVYDILTFGAKGEAMTKDTAVSSLRDRVFGLREKAEM